ncbi:MAG: class I SAM-dependent methyltransferase family protein [Candidatus Woesearchaeota archaeon]
MLALKVPLKKAEKTKDKLLKSNLLCMDYSIVKDEDFIFFPVSKRFKTEFEFADKKFSLRKKEIKTLREALKEKLSAKELELAKTAFDTIGSIAILEIDKELKAKAVFIADTLIRINKNIKTVLMKSSSHGGEFRTQKYKWLAGAKTKTAECRENNVVLRFDVEKVYFSVRLGTERKRIAEQVKKGEDILVMFSGCAPYPCVLSKNTLAGEIWGVEKNPEGHRWGMENVKLNKISNARLFCADVKGFKAEKRFDRILMPLPKSAEDFLDDAFRLAKDKAVIHFYDFLHRGEFDRAKEKVKAACKRNKIKCRFLRLVKCGQHSPRVFRICLDFEIRK